MSANFQPILITGFAKLLIKYHKQKFFFHFDINDYTWINWKKFRTSSFVIWLLNLVTI